jgi:hypothetical protein
MHRHKRQATSLEQVRQLAKRGRSHSKIPEELSSLVLVREHDLRRTTGQRESLYLGAAVEDPPTILKMISTPHGSPTSYPREVTFVD